MNVNDLIERLRSVKREVADDCGRMPDDPSHKCVFVDMRPDDFRALLREAADALEAARKDGWQPIETAPKDGSEIILFDPDYFQRSGFEGRYSAPRGNWLSSYDSPVNPTHWRPLPAPPAIESAREERDALAHGGEE